MAPKTNAVLSAQTPNSPMFEKQPGPLAFAWLKFFQNIGITINQNFNTKGQITGTVAPGSIVASTDNISDGTGSPLAGGKEAFLALVPGAMGDVLTYNGTDYGPQPLPTAPVTKIIAGSANVHLTPPSGLGDVAISVDIPGTGYSLGGALTTANVVVGAGAGAGASVTAVAGLDGNHQISLTTGTGPVLNGILFTVTFTITRGHVTYPVNKCVVVTIGHALIDFSPGSSASATGYVASNTGVDASTNYIWNVSCP